ncbi:hypothetical protein BJ085DRAFT_28873 [Dimargaris cristalligena]|uniref:Uncharacterized protein n=1 Tax=Dimargaris cristalligena TaxID=215637 RepID=A0A4Q0A0R6_9FUNG|nr:hypothetical protein BJ085DRAFT_28873 [Dimargaris cristalligena]|eukprot:RKP38710.1 hypothetical protein BJ085DRAFT_28873 [Dimargaris cristalligena]
MGLLELNRCRILEPELPSENSLEINQRSLARFRDLKALHNNINQVPYRALVRVVQLGGFVQPVLVSWDIVFFKMILALQNGQTRGHYFTKRSILLVDEMSECATLELWNDMTTVADFWKEGKTSHSSRLEMDIRHRFSEFNSPVHVVEHRSKSMRYKECTIPEPPGLGVTNHYKDDYLPWSLSLTSVGVAPTWAW